MSRRSAAASHRRRIRHVYRRQRRTPLASGMSKSRHQSQLGVDGLLIAYARRVAGCRILGNWFPPAVVCLSETEGAIKSCTCRMPHAACAGAGLSLDVADALLDGREFSHFSM
jgi:hypothetical protein